MKRGHISKKYNKKKTEERNRKEKEEEEREKEVERREEPGLRCKRQEESTKETAKEQPMRDKKD